MKWQRLWLLSLGSVIACAPPVTIATGTRNRAPPASPRDSAGLVVPAGTGSPIAVQIAGLTNEQRVAAGLPRLTTNERLMRAAQLQANQMAAARQVSHDIPSARYPTLRDRIDAVEYSWDAIAENLAADQRDAAGAVAGWMASPGHRANLLSRRFTELGTGFATDARGRRFYAQVFATPR
jgi:uncharacterized protein YkwD